MILEFLNALTQSGYRIFSMNDASKVAASIGIKQTSIHYILRALIAKRIIRPLFKGHYAVEENLLAGQPLHRFEIAMHIAPGGAICCWSAMEHHGLTDQILSKVYMLAPYQPNKPRSLYHYKVDGYEFVLIQTEKQNLWGIERSSVGERTVNITELERTLIDGVSKPQYCGGFREVLNAFSIASTRMDIDKLIEYTQKSQLAVKKRIGWVLDQLSIKSNLETPDVSYYDKLDPSSPRRGKYNKKWMLLENF